MKKYFCNIIQEKSRWLNFKVVLVKYHPREIKVVKLNVALGHWAISSGKVKVSQLSHCDVLSYGKSSVAEGAITHVIA